MDGIKKLTIKIVDKVKNYKGNFSVKTGTPDPVGPCPVCGGQVYETQKGFSVKTWKKVLAILFSGRNLKTKPLTREDVREL